MNPLPNIPREREDSHPIPRNSSTKFRLASIKEPDWQYFACGSLLTCLMMAMILRGSPAHGWLQVNLKPLPLLTIAILAAITERSVGHFIESKVARCVLFPPVIFTASLAVTAIFYYGQV